jgi:alkanesulfonate monooxygenase SsuD/methylene tetrahydromethanopterin reductase-like flavin-dependent oxidoreductase (luciferase family)/putative sterol carrier protein
VRFGLFYEHQLPRPHPEGAEEKLLHDALEQVELADKLGLHSVWEVEHHFLEEYSHSSAPEVFLAAASQRTKNIRLGHGIVQLPPGYNHPARVAERIATLDLISAGRVEFGTGESSSQAELGGFLVDRALKRAQWEEALDVVTRLLVEEPFAGHQGRFISMPPRNLVPKPKQKPHPPLWVACSRRDTILLAARKGIGALSFSFIEPEEARQWVDEYYALIDSVECVPAGYSVNPNVAVVVPFMCHPDEQMAIERGIDGAHFFGFSLAHYYVFGAHQPGHTNVWQEFERDRVQRGFARELVTATDAPLGVRLLQETMGSLRGAIGTPDQVRELLERYEAAGVDEVIFVSQAGRNKHEHICESIELFAREVLPHFEEKRASRETEKRERLAPAIERAMSRRKPAPPLPTDYTIWPDREPWHAATHNGANSHAPTQQRTLAQTAFSWLVHGRSDAQLEWIFSSAPGQALIFRGMQHAFLPERAAGVKGTIQYQVRSRRGTRDWLLRIADGQLAIEQRREPRPTVTVRLPAVTLARMAAGQLTAGAAALRGELEIDGDVKLAARLGEIMGRDPR